MLLRHARPLLVLLAALALLGCDDDGGNTATDSTSDTRVTDLGPFDGSIPDFGDTSITGPDGTDTADMVTVVDAEFGLDTRPANAGCLAHPEPPPSPAALAFERVFDDVSLSQPIFMAQAPGDDAIFYVVENAGRVVTLPSATAGEKDYAIDITDRVDDGPNEGGLLGMAFHPDFPATPEVFLSYTRGGPFTSRISRFTVDPATHTFDPDSEEIVFELEQLQGNHNGGGIGFGPDGHLYIGFGDGGGGGDPGEHGQNTDTLLGAFLRIDVDNPAGGNAYGIPSDNPFAQGGGAPEIFAWGLRNPWRWSFDRDTGELWAGDVGQNAYEEIDVIELGGNYGWDGREGFECYEDPECDGDYIDPVVALPQSGGDRSITGGYVYRGTELAGWGGTYIFGDFVSGNLYRVAYDADGEPFADLITSTSFGIGGFGEGNDGELYIVDYGGTIQKLTLADRPADNGFPTALSATGCVDASDPRRPSADAIPYAPVAQLWSDGAEKRRWFAMPDGATATVSADGRDLDFPIGTVFVKTFEFGGDPVETRLFMRHDDGAWAGYSYAWNEARTDAELLEGSLRRDLGDGTEWVYPSRGQCMQCHTAPAGFVLGPEIAQLNSDLVYPPPAAGEDAPRANQLATWDHIGLIEGGIDAATAPALVDPLDDAAGTVEDRARAYLHSNCSSCHQPGARTPVELDLRYHIALADTQTCDVEPGSQTLGVTDARRIAPGASERSLVALRMAETGLLRMPQIGTEQVHGPAVDLVSAWIDGLQGCE